MHSSQGVSQEVSHLDEAAQLVIVVAGDGHHCHNLLAAPHRSED